MWGSVATLCVGDIVARAENVPVARAETPNPHSWNAGMVVTSGDALKAVT